MFKFEKTVNVEQIDRRTKKGMRHVASIPVQAETEAQLEVMLDAALSPYRSNKYVVSIEDTWAEVKNLMTGKLVRIRNKDRGGPCDPSMERYWSM